MRCHTQHRFCDATQAQILHPLTCCCVWYPHTHRLEHSHHGHTHAERHTHGTTRDSPMSQSAWKTATRYKRQLTRAFSCNLIRSITIETSGKPNAVTHTNTTTAQTHKHTNIHFSSNIPHAIRHAALKLILELIRHRCTLSVDTFRPPFARYFWGAG